MKSPPSPSSRYWTVQYIACLALACQVPYRLVPKRGRAMKSETETRSTRKHQAIVEAARAVFFKKGYDGTSMEEIAAKASVSKQTVYKHFADKQRLFAEIILATTSEIDRVVALVAGTLVETRALKRDMSHLGQQFIALLMDPQL